MMLVYASCFSLSTLLLAVLIFYRLQTSLEEQVRTNIIQEENRLLVDYRQDGLQELLHDIRERVELHDGNDLLYALKDSHGRVLFDQEIAVNETAGWLQTHDAPALLISVKPLQDGYTLYVAEPLENIEELKTVLRNNVLTFLFFTLLFSVAGALLITRRFLRRVDEVTQTSKAIGRHSLSMRLPVSKANDDFDQLAETINAMLERIESLVHEIRHVTNSIAHDLRTPLTRVRQQLEAMSHNNAPTPEDAKHALAMLDETLQTFTAMLQLAELESGTTQQDFSKVCLNNVVESIYEIYLPLAEENDQQLLLNASGNVVVSGNKRLLTQLIVNLLENAIKHSGPGTTLTLSLEPISERQAILSVTDNGVGISAEDSALLFKPFYRGDRSRSTSGSGLGLSIVNAIANLHNAKISLQRLKPGMSVSLTFDIRRVD
ncbi:sensor histidine kinase [Alteromonas confluentis]|uniref:histidine kinase n=1 Tax=Alteromonas confluentis TaxID=1656094 RepID=A0A1E7Z7A0_9ALTE|nr:ATP-binding protein [Alteromonas confluentis]OFC69423.1 hypothetical protein BFC18_18620 [Alteromonas confluentis]